LISEKIKRIELCLFNKCHEKEMYNYKCRKFENEMALWDVFHVATEGI
jgi:hypothetical protein